MKEIVMYDPARKAFIGMVGPDEPSFGNPQARWTYYWEKFAGKPYKKAEHHENGDTIRDIVRRGQDMLCRMNDHLFCNQLRAGVEYFVKLHNSSYTMTNEETGAIYHTPYSSELAGPPQSLGELCIEIAQAKIKDPLVRVKSNGYWTYTMTTYGYRVNPDIRGDIQQLKQVMYYKRKNHPYGDGIGDDTEYVQARIGEIAGKY